MEGDSPAAVRCRQTPLLPASFSFSPLPHSPTQQAIEKKGTSDVKDWAEYWVVLSTFNVTQWAIDFVLCFLPFYYIAKLGFLCALWHPR